MKAETGDLRGRNYKGWRSEYLATNTSRLVLQVILIEVPFTLFSVQPNGRLSSPNSLSTAKSAVNKTPSSSSEREVGLTKSRLIWGSVEPASRQMASPTIPPPQSSSVVVLGEGGFLRLYCSLIVDLLPETVKRLKWQNVHDLEIVLLPDPSTLIQGHPNEFVRSSPVPHPHFCTRRSRLFLFLINSIIAILSAYGDRYAWLVQEEEDANIESMSSLQ